MKPRTIFIALLVLAGLLFAYFWLTREKATLAVEATAGTAPTIAKPRDTLLPTVGIAKAVGWPSGAAPVAAAGLQVAPFAMGLDHPRSLLVLPNGDVLVAETNAPPREGGGVKGWIMEQLMKRAGAGVPSANRITLLRDGDGDGVAESRSVLVGGLNAPFGMALVGDHLYVANTDALVRFAFKPGQTKISAPAEKIVALPAQGPNMHWTRNIVASADGTKMYVAVGSNSNVAETGVELEKGRAAVWEVDLKTRDHRVWAAGLRNPVGLALQPGTGTLWATVNERDMLGSDLVPDYLTSVQFGGFYGWPDFYWGGYIDPRIEAPREEMQQYVIRPDYALGAHVAALGLSFGEGAKLGERFAGGAFVAEHGSWNRKPLSGYKVVFVPFANGRPTGKPVDVLAGFVDRKGRAQGRPVGVAIDRGGALLVSDDVGNRVWRVTAR